MLYKNKICRRCPLSDQDQNAVITKKPPLQIDPSTYEQSTPIPNFHYNVFCHYQQLCRGDKGMESKFGHQRPEPEKPLFEIYFYMNCVSDVKAEGVSIIKLHTVLFTYATR